MFPDTGLMESTLPAHRLEPLQGKNSAPTKRQGAGEGLLVARILVVPAQIQNRLI